MDLPELHDSAAPQWLQDGGRHIWLPYTQMATARAPLPVVGGDGTRLHLADGRRLIDGISSWWTAAHGYGHPHIVEAIREQACTLPHVMLGGLAHEQAYRLATRLANLLPGDLDHVFFTESGSVSVEVAMKMATQYWLSQGKRRTRFLSFVGGYHGDTFATMSVCDPDEGMHTMFKGIVPEQFVVEIPSNEAALAAFEETLKRHGESIAAVIMEPLVQGAGGMRFHDGTVLRAVREACDRHSVLLIFDEIFVGFARTGEGMFACEASGVIPDIVTVSKALTGGTLPLAATIASEGIYASFLSDSPQRALMHGPTYMGNPLGCAAANASLDLFAAEPRVAQARQIGEWLLPVLKQAEGIAGVRDVRVKGAIGVIQLDRPVPADAVSAHCIERGVWLRPFGDIIYTTPPLIASEEDVTHIGQTMVSAASAA